MTVSNSKSDTPKRAELEKQLNMILSANMPIHAEHSIDKRNIINNFMPLVEQEIAETVLQAQLALILYFDQTPTNESMDWKGLFSDSRKVLQKELETLRTIKHLKEENK